MRGFKKALTVAVASVIITVFGLVALGAPAQAAAWKRFRFAAIYAGDCTMSPGATWTIYSDGTAFFDGTVSSTSGDDAWLMWANLKDQNRTTIGQITNANGDPKFVRNLPGAQRWFANGYFPAAWYPHISYMSMSKHC